MRDRPRPGETEPPGSRQWVSFEDPGGDRTWIFDVTFLTSSWTCIYGRGCPGVTGPPDPAAMIGCCNEGVAFQDAADFARVDALATRLGADEWQYHDGGAGYTEINEDGGVETKVVDGACIFLNRPGFAAGAGCALHLAAVARGEQPLDWKPDMCWQVPLKVDDYYDDEYDGHSTSVVRRLEHRHFGDSAHWWCVDAPEAQVGTRPVYEEMGPELEALAGEEVAGALVAYLRALPAPAAPGVPVADPQRRAR